MLITVGAGIIKKGLITLGSIAATHGVINSNQTETFVAGGMFLVGVLWSLWQDYGKAIILSQLEVLKAKSLAQAEKMRNSNVPPVTVQQIANQSNKMNPTDVASAIETLPANVKASISPATIAKVLMVAFVVSAFLAGNPAAAQTKLRLPIDPLGLNAKTAPTSSDPLANIVGALDAKLLPDLVYAKAMADASGSKVTAPCYGAWIDLINVRQKAVADKDGQPIAFPDPGLVSRFEQIVELRNALQPDSTFMIACSPVASMVKKDIVGFIGIVISGGAGLATLVPGL
jgi:hypothetical protein